MTIEREVGTGVGGGCGADQSPRPARTPEDGALVTLEGAVDALLQSAPPPNYEENDFAAGYVEGLSSAQRLLRNAIPQSVEGVHLTAEEAALVARCARSFRGDRQRDITDLPSLEPGTVYERLRLLAEKCEAAS